MPVKFGTFVPQGWRMDLVDVKDPVEKYETMTRFGVEAEKAGFESIWLYDHFHTVPEPVLETTFECWISTAALARDTSTVRIGQMVGCNSYRNPALLAKMASTIDVLSHGRLDFGIGAGWYEHEYKAFGYPYPEAPERLRMLGEALQVFKAMWTEDYATFEGKYYQVRGAINEPKGVQKPHIPIWIGGGGEKVTLKLVAKYGDACNIGGLDTQVYRHKFDVLRKHCEDVGRDYNEIIKSGAVNITLLKPGEDADKSTERWRRGESLEKFRQGNFAGTSEEAVELLNRLAEAGVDYFIIYFQMDMTQSDMLYQFAEEVIPKVKGGVKAAV